MCRETYGGWLPVNNAISLNQNPELLGSLPGSIDKKKNISGCSLLVNTSKFLFLNMLNAPFLHSLMNGFTKRSWSGKNKRKWKKEEDYALIEVLNDHMNSGTSFKADNRFKSGLLNTVVEKLRAKLPKSNVKSQHVHSRLRHFKGVYNIVHDKVVGSCISKFGWDPETKQVVADKEVWKAYVKNHRKVNDWGDTQEPKEIEDEVNEEEENEESRKKDEPESSST
ncbi:hypothetical protein Cgig2_015244 [Carnegiea gigantea]|uniref:Myb/SANT-like domain-containing protein n=1 Tax=Carnegiea gigantea TaxID=171969 RepID=A0A9Q1QJG0_9CARY|nr:hypothetical protein Cgig2_015244 [Carnegiea gigantea]